EVPNIIKRSDPLSEERKYADPAYDHYTALLRSGLQLLHDERMDLAGIDCAYGGGQVRTDLLQQLNITIDELPQQPLFWIAYYRTKDTLEALTPEEKVKYEINKKKESIRRLKLINEWIARSGVTYPLSKAQVEMIADIQLEVGNIRTMRFGNSSRIYCDLETFLRIVTKSLPELKTVGTESAMTVIPYKSGEFTQLFRNVLSAVDAELHAHFLDPADSTFSRSGEESVAFNGNRYSFEIESDGKVLLFHTHRG
ncbi:MAG: hypothetical protein ACOYNS_09240, partial [Bacteroidota bacterium]